ncbi:hypothetical protein K474DRAFT_1561156, partial [Panus rudis PR-1116 ss-1]
LQCRRCCVISHRSNPFHRILRWNGQCFTKTTLKTCGLKIQLGHRPDEACACPAPGPSDFVVMHTNGFHPVDIFYCECDKGHIAGNRLQQLLRAELYPATVAEPTTACTFRVLEAFHVLTLQSKLTIYDYYHSLEMMMDHSGLAKSLRRQHAVLRMVREWRLLKALKRAGRGHDKRGVEGTERGELCVACPACPVPGRNIPDNWHEVSDDLKFLYFSFVAVDANFRLKQRAISNESRDPASASGWGYMVEDKPYRAHVAQYADQEDMSSCAGFAALTQANTKYSKGYATTGVGMAIDARHGFVLRNGVGDLQKGERYCNMDYILASALSLLPDELRGVISYDIVCAWVKHWLERLSRLPEHLHVNIPEGKLRYAIPKYHLNGHRREDHNQYSLNLIPGAAQTDGKEIERNWSRHDGIANSTREMGPGSRHDTLEDHFGFANWKKYINMGISLRNRLQEAQLEQKRLHDAFERFKSERGLDPANVELWTKEVVAWEHDQTRPDPYYIPPSGLTQNDIQLQLAEEEEQHDMPILHDLSPSGFVAALLSIEDEQRRFRLQHYNPSGTPPSPTVEIVTKRAALRRQISSIRAAQAIYMSPVPPLLAENTPLFLPSALTLEQRELCSSGLAELESRLREGQMRDALDELRIKLHLKSALIGDRVRNVRHQVMATRSQQRFAANESKIITQAEKYRAAHRAKLLVAGHGEWESDWPELKKEDVRTLQEDAFDLDDVEDGSAPTSEGRREISWIWISADRQGSRKVAKLPGANDALCVEFLKARARARRWTEEVLLVQEEQRRVLVSLEKTALEWEAKQAFALTVSCPVQQQGLRAYAARQAFMRRHL